MLRVVCAYTPSRLRRGTVEALVAQAPQAEFVDVGERPDSYFDLFCELWAAGEDFMLVEHDIDANFTLSDRLTVMVNGQVIASGLPADVRADQGVQAAYLGEELNEVH
jgi:ABC-type uncharacterized transport system ATPase subunit